MMTKEQMMQDAQTLQQIFMRLRIATEQTGTDPLDTDGRTRARIMANATYHVGAAFEQLEKAAQGTYVASAAHHAAHGNDWGAEAIAVKPDSVNVSGTTGARQDVSFLSAKLDRTDRGR
jgi:hypothetical protein